MPFKDFTAGDILTASDVDTYLMGQAVIVCTSTSRPISPVTGMRIWQTDTLSTYVYSGASWRFLNGLSQFVRKSVDESLTSSTTVQDDDELFVAVVANAVYRIQTFIRYNSPTAADMRLTWSGPSGTVLRWGTFAPHIAQTNRDSVTVGFGVFNLTDGADVGGFGGNAVAIPMGLLTTSGSAGTLRLRWAQSTSTASATTVRAGSCLYAERLG
ncbi:hypothetical protein ACQPYK_08540 [Streptosporangium sp. CA-135522]|uniref:hypothetical protein n=1 Tax=Streptosporangium sp. CA-135522 TaxID=3240072 RepID=UPI003D8E419B